MGNCLHAFLLQSRLPCRQFAYHGSRTNYCNGFLCHNKLLCNSLSGVYMVMDGQMFFSTTCDTTNIFTAQAPFDTLPGTAYLLNFDFRDPLMCCFEPSCSETSFYFRMHLGRTYPQGDCNQTFVYYTPFSLAIHSIC